MPNAAFLLGFQNKPLVPEIHTGYPTTTEFSLFILGWGGGPKPKPYNYSPLESLSY